MPETDPSLPHFTLFIHRARRAAMLVPEPGATFTRTQLLEARHMLQGHGSLKWMCCSKLVAVTAQRSVGRNVGSEVVFEMMHALADAMAPEGYDITVVDAVGYMHLVDVVFNPKLTRADIHLGVLDFMPVPHAVIEQVQLDASLKAEVVARGIVVTLTGEEFQLGAVQLGAALIVRQATVLYEADPGPEPFIILPVLSEAA